MISVLEEEIGLQLSQMPFSLIIEEARNINWTRDPFDRIITAEAIIKENDLLITKDTTIRKYCEITVW
ncbi:hypothetical protein QUF70_20190 [Desulfobacterales bacterium HSG17]|nr:hypothetical protein [Desulfobacterales bacterium HSG17]